MSLPPRAPAAAWEAKLSSSSAASSRDLMVAYAYSGSTSAGTYSTTYKSSRSSVMSSEPDLASQLSRIVLMSKDDEERLKKIKRAKRLVKELCHGDGDTGSLVERWLSEMCVGWVLDLSDDLSAGINLLRAQPQHNNLTETWIRALSEITESTRHCFRLIVLGGEQDVSDPVQLVRFLDAAVLKMISFVDALLSAVVLDAGTDTNGAQAPAEEKLQILLDVRDAVSTASIGIQLFFESWDSSVQIEAQRSSGEVLSLLSAKEQGLDKAVWNTMEEVRTSILILNDGEDKWGTKTPQGSTDICKVTRSLVSYIKYLWGDYGRVDHIVRTAAKLGNCVPEQDKTNPLATLAVEMVSSLELKLDKRSISFPDQSLRFLFLINNTHFIWQQLHPLFRLKFHMAALTPKIEEYIQQYLQVSWEPVLSCLYNHTPRWFRKKSGLPKFDSEFQKTYTAQKLWKVPDPELRRRLRKAIVGKVVSGLTRYLEDNNVTKPRVTPQEREKMLLELFEG